MTTDELRRALAEAWDEGGEHVERLTLATAVLQTALREAGMEATLVGGGAVEFYIPDAYTTSDIDLVWSAALAKPFTRFSSVSG